MPKKTKSTVRFRHKKTGKFVKNSYAKRYPHLVKKSRVDTRSKKTKLYDKLGLKTKRTVRFRQKKTGKFVKNSYAKRYPHLVKKSRVDTRSKKTKFYDKLGLKTKKQQQAFDRQAEKFLENDRYRRKILKRIEEAEQGLRPGLGGKEDNYENYKKRMLIYFDNFQNDSVLPEFRTLARNFFKVQNTPTFRKVFAFKTDKRT